jgi:hypothetical protein
MIKFNPMPCPCRCKKFIMSPYFGCQCSSVRAQERDELLAMERDASRYKWLRDVADKMPDPCSFASDVFKGGSALDDLCDQGIREQLIREEKENAS